MQRSACVFMVGFVLSACVRHDVPMVTDTGSLARVYFTPGPECEDIITDLIDSARTIRIAVYAITNTAIGGAILSAYERGAYIRIISDRTQAQNKVSLIGRFRDVGIPVVLNRGYKYKIEHNKFAVFDNKTVITGSYNWTSNATKYNSENCVVLPTLSAEYTARFDAPWNKYTNNQSLFHAVFAAPDWSV